MHLFFFAQDQKNERKNSVSVVWVDERRKVLSLVHIPDELEYMSPTVGSYPFASIEYAYRAQGKPIGLLGTELSIFLRTRIFGVATLPIPVDHGKQSVALALLKGCLTRSGTNLTVTDCLHFIGMLTSPSFTIREVDFPPMASSTVNALGIKEFNRPVYTKWLSDHFPSSFGFSGQSLAVVNASGVSGVGKEAATVFSDLGFSVLTVTDGQSEKNGTFIAKDTQDVGEQLPKYLSQFFKVAYEKSAELPSKYRTQYVFIIGENQVSYFSK